MQQQEAVLAFKVVRGIDLPRTDGPLGRGKIDAFVRVVSSHAGEHRRTRAVDDDLDPTFEQTFAFHVPLAGSGGAAGGARLPAATLTLELWDANTLRRDALVGACAPLDVGAALAAAAAAGAGSASVDYLELPIVTWANAKHGQQGRRSRLVVAIVGWVTAFGTLVNELRARQQQLLLPQPQPPLIINAAERRAYAPLVMMPGLPPGLVWFGVEYEDDSKQKGAGGGPAVDVKLFVTQPAAPLHLELSLTGSGGGGARTVTKLRRRSFASGLAVAPGLVAYEELKLDDVPLSADFSQLQILAFDRSPAPLWAGTADAVVTAHGWRGSLTFEQAARTLRGVEVDHAEKEIYFPLGADGAQLMVDWDDGDVDIKLGVQPSAPDTAWDLHCTAPAASASDGGGAVKKTSCLYAPPRAALGGRLPLARVLQLDDLRYGLDLRHVQLAKFGLANARCVPVGAVLPLR